VGIHGNTHPTEKRMVHVKHIPVLH